MNKGTSLLLLILLLYTTRIAQGQINTIPDPDIKKMVTEISAANLEATVRKLASFETRHTLSTTKNTQRGIGAARNWVKGEFEKYAKTSAGRMKVELDGYVQEPDGKRINRSVQILNVMATLKGSNPADDRVFVVSGHLDSRNTDIMDSVGLAPGANDDGSGVALVMELARVMAPYQFSATIIFVAVSGEEQGLQGSRYLSNKALNEK